MLFKILVPIGDQKDNFKPHPCTRSWYKGCEHPHPFFIGVHPILEVLPKITSTCFPYFSCGTLIYQHLAEFLEVDFYISGILVFDPHARFPFPLQAILSLFITISLSLCVEVSLLICLLLILWSFSHLLLIFASGPLLYVFHVF